MIIYLHKSSDTYEHTLDEDTLKQKYDKLITRQRKFPRLYPLVEFTYDTWVSEYKTLWYTHFPEIKYRPYNPDANKRTVSERNAMSGKSTLIKLKDGLLKDYLYSEPRDGIGRPRRPVSIKGDLFDSVATACDVLHLDYQFILYRCKSITNAFPDWFFCDQQN